MLNEDHKHQKSRLHQIQESVGGLCREGNRDNKGAQFLHTNAQ